MKKLFFFSIIVLVMGIWISGCSSIQATQPVIEQSQVSTPTPRLTFQPGDPTSVPPGSQISDPDFQAAVSAYKNRDFEQVQKLMEKVIRQNPQLAPPYWYLGRALYEQGDYESALQQMEKALAIDPNYALAYADRGIIYSALGNESQGLADLQHALEIDPSLAKVHHNLAVYHYNKGEMDLALQEYDLALQIDPTRSSSWQSRAEVLHDLGQLDECIESATHAIDNDSKNWSAYAMRASCYAEKGNFEQASADISQAMKNGFQDATIVGRACNVMVKAKANEQAVEYCSLSIALEPGRYESFINRGVAHFNAEQYQQAIDDFTSALQFGEIPVAYQNRGNAYMKLSNFQAAVEDYQKSLALYPSGYVYYSLGFAYTQLQQYEDAQTAFEQGDLLEPERSSENYRLWGKARAYDRLEQDDQALELYTQLIDQYQRTEAYYFRGRIYETKGFTEEAISDYELLLELAKQVPDDFDIQTMVYDANKRLQELKK